MKINTFKYFFIDAIKNLTRNITITIASVISIAGSLFILGAFLLYIIAINDNSVVIFMKEQAVITVFRCIEVALLILFPGISLLLVINTIKIAVYSRKSEISIMKYVGATNWFIRWPYIIEGLVIGIIGAFVGNISLFITYSLIYNKAREVSDKITLVQPTFVTNTMLWQFGIIGAFIGAIASIISLRKILKL